MPKPSVLTSAGTAPHRLRGLLQAHRTITSDLSLETMLGRIVEAACELVGSRYGALGVIAADGTLEQFVQHGMDDATSARIGASSTGADLFAALVGDAPRPTFLRVPIRVRAELFGDLYLAEPEFGPFTDDDEELLTALAATAGTAIENARLYDDARHSRDWLHASGEIARALLANADVDMLLEVVSRALHVAEADYGALILPTEDGQLQVMVTAGLGARDFRGRVFRPADSLLGTAIVAGESILMSDLTEMARAGFENVHDYGPAMIAPLVDAKGTRGAVILIRTAHRRPFSSRDLDRATAFATQVALALEMNDARADAELLHVLEVRHRIAEDLHDNVMQRLFAIGVGLQGLAARPLTPDSAQRLSRHIDDLDDTIDQIRTRVFGLRGEGADAGVAAPSRFPRVARGEETGSAPR